MNAAGLVLAIAGVWVISQVFAGHALERLNIMPAPAATSSGDGGGVPDAVPGGRSNPPFIDFGQLGRFTARPL